MRTLSLSSFAVLLACAFCAKVAAQAAVYGEVNGTNFGYTVNGGGLSFGTDGLGGTFGGFYNFPIASRLTAGIDAHVGFGTGSVGGVKGLALARFGFVPNHNPLRPYVEIGGGFVSAHVPRLTNIVGPQTISTGALGIGFGLDVRLTDRLDYRAIELESAAGGGARDAGSASVSTGIVYHFAAAPRQHT